MNPLCDVQTHEHADEGKDGHDREDDVITSDTGIGIQARAVDCVHESAGQIADEGGHGHSRAGDFTRNVNFIHRSEIDSAHAVDAGADAQGDDDASHDAEGFKGQPGESNEDDSRQNEGDAHEFCRRMEDLIGQETANRAADHFQTVLIDDTIDADESDR